MPVVVLPHEGQESAAGAVVEHRGDEIAGCPGVGDRRERDHAGQDHRAGGNAGRIPAGNGGAGGQLRPGHEQHVPGHQGHGDQRPPISPPKQEE